jgi:hypothetical protein
MSGARLTMGGHVMLLPFLPTFPEMCGWLRCVWPQRLWDGGVCLHSYTNRENVTVLSQILDGGE